MNLYEEKLFVFSYGIEEYLLKVLKEFKVMQSFSITFLYKFSSSLKEKFPFLKKKNNQIFSKISILKK